MKILFLCLSEPLTPYSPGVAALSAAVRARGHESAFLPISLESTVEDAARRAAEVGADVIGVGIMTRDWPGVRSLLPRLKAKTNAFVVVGGYHATLAARHVAKSTEVDAICIGEGERALPDLLDMLARGAPRHSFPGMWVRGEDGFADPIPPGAPERDIAKLPDWDYEVFGDVSAMLAGGINILGAGKDRFLPTRASRGCPFDCTYCSAPRWERAAGFDAEGTRNVRPVIELCRELALLRDRYQPSGFEFWDEHFPVSVEWLAELAREYPRRVGLPFRVEMHPSAATTERLTLLAKAGCEWFHCGVEAGDPEYRRRVLNRRSSDRLLQRLFDDTRALGIGTSASVMMALPGETFAQAQATIDLLRRLRPGRVICSTYVPLPGTPLGGDLFELEEREVSRLDGFRRCAPVIDFERLNEREISTLNAAYDALNRELAQGGSRGTSP